MKILHLKLKRDVLIVDLPENDELVTIGIDTIYYAFKHDGREKYTKVANSKEWTFLCQGTPNEEQCKELVEFGDKEPWSDRFIEGYLDYDSLKETGDNYYSLDSKQSFLSAISVEGWNWQVNPIEDPDPYNEKYRFDLLSFHNDLKAWQEAESRTFKNPIIFIKE